MYDAHIVSFRRRAEALALLAHAYTALDLLETRLQLRFYQRLLEVRRA